MTIQVLDGNGVLQTVQNMNDFMTANPAGPQTIAASRAVAPPITIDSVKFRINASSGSNNTLVSAAARVVRSLDIYNRAAYVVYFRFFDKATTPITADVPFWTIPLPADSGYSKQFIWGLPVSAGLGFNITKDRFDNDATAVAVDDVSGMLTYR
jgi:hypothetical protein